MRHIFLFLSILVFVTQPVNAGINSLNFDGGNDEVDWGNVNNTTTGNRSVCIWTRPDQSSAHQALAGKLQDFVGDAGYFLAYDSTTDFGYILIKDGTEQVQSDTTTDIDLAWHFICATWSSSDEVTTIYVDGVQEDTDTGGGSVDSISNAIEFAVGEMGDETRDATMDAAWVLTQGAVWNSTEINNARWHPESISKSGTTIMVVPLWYGGGVTQTDVANNIDGTPSGVNDSAIGPPVMVGGYGASY